MQGSAGPLCCSAVSLLLFFGMLHEVLALAHHARFLLAGFRNFRAGARSSLENFAQELGITVFSENEFGVSRPTGYRWINRYKESGPEGLLNLSSKPHGCSHATPVTIENAILALRDKYPYGERESLRRG